MKDVIIDRLSCNGGGLIFYRMKKATDTMETRSYRMPTTAELYALEQRAREERARVIAAGIRSFYERVASALTAKVVRHA